LEGSTGFNLQKIFSLLQSSDNESIELVGKNLCRQIAHSMSIDTRIQEDAEEFFLRLLECIDLNLPSDKPKLSSIFDIKLQQCIRCIDVEHHKFRTQKYFDLSIDIPSDSGGSVVANLTTSIQHIFQTELIKGENKYRTKEYGLQNAEKTVTISSFPQTLVVHLKRFAFDVESGKMSKVTFDLPSSKSTNWC